MENVGQISTILLYIATIGVISGCVLLSTEKHPNIKGWARSIFYLILVLYVLGSFALVTSTDGFECVARDEVYISGKRVFICKE